MWSLVSALKPLKAFKSRKHKAEVRNHGCWEAIELLEAAASKQRPQTQRHQAWRLGHMPVKETSQHVGQSQKEIVTGAVMTPSSQANPIPM